MTIHKTENGYVKAYLHMDDIREALAIRRNEYIRVIGFSKPIENRKYELGDYLLTIYLSSDGYVYRVDVELVEKTREKNEEHDELPIRYDTFPGDYMSENSNDSKPNDLIEFYISNETNEYEKVCVSREEVKHAADIIRTAETPVDGFRVSGYDNDGNRYGSVEVKLDLFNEAISMRLFMDKRSYSSGRVRVIMRYEQSPECRVRFVRKGQLDCIFKKDLSYFELNDKAIDIYEDEEAEDPIKTVALRDIEIDPNYMGQEMFDIFNSVINKED